MLNPTASLPEAVVAQAAATLAAGAPAAATELGPDRIRVNAISPSTVATEGVRAILPAEVIAARVGRTPLHRLGETGDIASAALFLASSTSSFITGQVLTVDGGLATAFL